MWWLVGGSRVLCCLFFFLNDTATTEIYTLSLHDAPPISPTGSSPRICRRPRSSPTASSRGLDRKSTRLNSSHANISYAVFCLKKKTLFAKLQGCLFNFSNRDTVYSINNNTDKTMHFVRYEFFFFNDTETTEIYTLSLHDALPISIGALEEKSIVFFGRITVDEFETPSDVT